MKYASTESEKQQALEQFQRKQKNLYNRGKIIVLTIAIINMVGSISSALINFDLLTLLIQFALSFALIFGVSWVRYFYAIGSALGVLLILYLLMGGSVNTDPLPLYKILLLCATMVYQIACCIVLFVSKSVSEFLYAQKNG